MADSASFEEVKTNPDSLPKCDYCGEKKKCRIWRTTYEESYICCKCLLGYGFIESEEEF